MNITGLAFTCYAVSGLKNARLFYEGVLGLKPTSEWLMGPEGDQGMIEYDLGAGTLAIGCGAPMFKPGGNNVCAALEVADFEEALRQIGEKGVKVTMPANETPVCWMALIEDADGNPIMLHRRKQPPA